MAILGLSVRSQNNRVRMVLKNKKEKERERKVAQERATGRKEN